MRKIAIVTTHPIQYNAPLFALLNERENISVKVFYTWGDTVLQNKYDPGFDKIIEWDIPLLHGYDYEFLKNIAKEKGSHHYKGIVNPQIIEKISAYSPDAIMVYGWKFDSHLKVLRYFKNKIPVWFRGDSILLNEKRNLKSILKNILLKWVYSHVDIAFYTGTHNKAYFKKSGLKVHQLVEAFHAVDNNRFYNNENIYTPAALDMRDKLGIGRQDLIFLFAGKLTPTKDLGNLLEAFTSIKNRNVHLVIVGNGPEEQKLKNRYGLVRNVHFIEFQNQAKMPAVYQMCDIFVLPSIGETWGLCLNEAMAAGKAVLASDKCGGAIDLISDGENGYIFSAGNVKDLTAKMETFIKQKVNLEIMKANSLRRVQQFTFAAFADAIENMFENNNG